MLPVNVMSLQKDAGDQQVQTVTGSSQSLSLFKIGQT